ncbi:MAG: hypothetical protein P1U77_28810, partial [Rubripirellula sp.]|nr:hypothetical protein [Rubripirellula sp.]
GDEMWSNTLVNPSSEKKDDPQTIEDSRVNRRLARQARTYNKSCERVGRLSIPPACLSSLWRFPTPQAYQGSTNQSQIRCC